MFKIEMLHGKQVLSGKFIHHKHVKPHQEWVDIEKGRVVTVEELTKDTDGTVWITYKWYEGDQEMANDKENIAFQNAHSLIVDITPTIKEFLQ